MSASPGCSEITVSQQLDTQRNQLGLILKSHPRRSQSTELNEQTAGKATHSQVLGILGVNAQKTLSHRCTRGGMFKSKQKETVSVRF